MQRRAAEKRAQVSRGHWAEGALLRILGPREEELLTRFRGRNLHKLGSLLKVSLYN